MANPSPALKYRVTEGIFDTKSLLDEENFYHQRQGAPSELTKRLTYIMGDYTKNFPISLMTLGGVGFDHAGQASGVQEVDDVQFTYPVMGRLHKALVCSSTSYTDGVDKPGIGNSIFKINFPDRQLKRYYVIQSARGVQAYIHNAGEQLATGEWQYDAQLDPAAPSDFCPVSELQQGSAWIDLTTAVAESESRTTEGNMALPGSFKNQMTFMRHGFSWAGNAANKVMKLHIKTDKGETNVWMDFAMWQYELQWLSMCEHNYWYSRYNRQANGEILLKDLLTGKVIPRGSGILEQIQNKSTYSTLTYDYLSNQIGDALFGQDDTGNMSITLHGGSGAAREFHRAMIKAGATILTDLGNVADKFITGSGRNLALGGYFDTFYHIDGHVIKFKKNPVFDKGKVATAQIAGGVVHPETGWPLESYRMVFLDDSDYDGQPNIKHVAQKGRSFMHGVVAGLTHMPKSLQVMNSSFNVSGEDAQLISSDQDKSAYTRFKSAGIQILRANKCFDFQCIAGQ